MAGVDRIIFIRSTPAEEKLIAVERINSWRAVKHPKPNW
jgi:hypothetical protein